MLYSFYAFFLFIMLCYNYFLNTQLVSVQNLNAYDS